MGLSASAGRSTPRSGGVLAQGIPDPLALGSPLFYVRQSGLTVSSGVVAAWDAVGSAGLRFEAPTVAERPTAAVTAGGLVGARSTVTGGVRYLRSTAAIQVPEPYLFWATVRVDGFIANDRVIDFDAFAYLAFYASSGNRLRWEHGGTDLVSTSTVADGQVLQVAVKVAAVGGRSRLYVNGVEEHDLAGTAAAPASRAVGIGARNDGAAAGNSTTFEAAVYPFDNNDEMDAFPLDKLHAWGAAVVARAA